MEPATHSAFEAPLHTIARFKLTACLRAVLDNSGVWEVEIGLRLEVTWPSAPTCRTLAQQRHYVNAVGTVRC